MKIGLELVPRKGRNEDQYSGYFVLLYRVVTEPSARFWVPFLDALSVSARDFVKLTVTDDEGNVTRIGKWLHDKKTIISAQLCDREDNRGGTRKDVNWFGPAKEDAPVDPRASEKSKRKAVVFDEFGDSFDAEDEDEFDEEVDDADEDVDDDFDTDDDEPEYVEPTPKRSTKPATRKAPAAKRVPPKPASKARRRQSEDEEFF